MKLLNIQEKFIKVKRPKYLIKLAKNLIKFEEKGTKVYIPKERYTIDLSLTENPLKFSKKILKVIDKEKYNINHYSDPYNRELKKALSKKFGIHENKLIFGAGADGIIENIVRILINPGEKLLMPDLTFLNASFAAIIAGGKPIFSKMNKEFHIDFDNLKNKIDKDTKMIFLCNPNNPTGLIESKKDIIDLVKSTDALVVVDEANIEFGGESVIKYVNNFDNLIVIRTFSKAYGLAGMRIGYCAGNEELMYYMWRLRPPFVNTYIAQKCALEALKDRKHIEKTRKYIGNERNFLSKELRNMDFYVVNSSTNCFLAKVTPHFKSSTEFNNLLHKNDCNVVDGKNFRSLGTDYVRIAPQLHSTNIKFVKIVDRLLKEKAK
ncbi:aminotransferase class I/II-fold pyridoxal phosphate-dependent enzyme [Candidatus Woesearchaeota archaeon]|nr:aminotransferase class I/II-fold pyridoxal phosphate-dependent enzyme [Candidatus Woesearchaeota archaeon]